MSCERACQSCQSIYHPRPARQHAVTHTRIHQSSAPPVCSPYIWKPIELADRRTWHRLLQQGASIDVQLKKEGDGFLPYLFHHVVTYARPTSYSSILQYQYPDSTCYLIAYSRSLPGWPTLMWSNMRCPDPYRHWCAASIVTLNITKGKRT